ncbi:hypothetical protein HU200_009192 [Digitaria exilis]|uniref:Uncharacterized protein n=1 Tax=Digitaria exilis TaxID=1010633 RepID=A0A835FME6_9POAL|nr:hypothetical protein HU200_009192 [Digitaria exilis]
MANRGRTIGTARSSSPSPLLTATINMPPNRAIGRDASVHRRAPPKVHAMQPQVAVVRHDEQVRRHERPPAPRKKIGGGPHVLGGDGRLRLPHHIHDVSQRARPQRPSGGHRRRGHGGVPVVAGGEPQLGNAPDVADDRQARLLVRRELLQRRRANAPEYRHLALIAARSLSHLVLQRKPDASHMCATIKFHTYDRLHE